MISIINQQNLRPFNTFRIDAVCDRWIEFTSPSDVDKLHSLVKDAPWTMIGQGSNMLFCGDFQGSVVHSRILDINSKSVGSGRVEMRVGSGIEMDLLIDQLVKSGLWGAENLSGIPGDVGAAAVQNVGAYGVEACDFIQSVEVYDTSLNRIVEIPVRDCDYGYRHSMFKLSKGRYIITHVNMTFSTSPNPKLEYGALKEKINDSENLSEIRKAILYIRNQKLPSVNSVGSAGSFFKNPIVGRHILKQILDDYKDQKVPYFTLENGYKIPAAWLIEQCGLKGYEKGNVGIWHKQPLVIVNLTGKATSAEILQMERFVIDRVKDKFDIELTPEVEHIFSSIDI